MTPDELARKNSEHGHQRALFAWANIASRFGFEAAWDDRSYREANYARDKYGTSNAVPELKRMHAIANGGKRDKITAAMLKAEGVKKGVPDVFLPVPLWNAKHGAGTRTLCGHYIELKRPKAKGQAAGSTSDEQDDWIGWLRGMGYAVSVCFDWRSAAKEVQTYMAACQESWRVYAELKTA
jgi:hypothetical protein